MAARQTRKEKRRKKQEERAGPYSHSADNAKLVLTGCVAKTAIPTRDPFDRAHLTPDGMGMLLPAGLRSDDGRPDRVNPLVAGRPRRYHQSQCVAVKVNETGHLTGVGMDSMWDGWWERVGELHAAGITVMGRGPSQAEVLYDLNERAGDRMRLRDILHPKVHQKVTREQRALEKAANRLIAAAERGEIQPQGATERHGGKA